MTILLCTYSYTDTQLKKNIHMNVRNTFHTPRKIPNSTIVAD